MQQIQQIFGSFPSVVSFEQSSSHLWNPSFNVTGGFFFFFPLLIKDIRKLDQRRKNKKRESSNWIPPCRRLCWKQEPKGVITYTPKSDMTIHLGVVAGPAGEGWGGSRLTVWLLTVSLGWLVRISHCVSALDTQQIKISTIADRQPLVELGFGFYFPFILKIWAQLTLPQSVQLQRGDDRPKDETSLALRTDLETLNRKRVDLRIT